MQKIVHFLSYHNAVPIALGILFLGGTAAMAASPEVRDQVYSETEETLSIDNTYLVNMDVLNYTPRIEITGVTEDEENYYLSYNLYTVGIEDAVWKDIVQGNTLSVAKGILGEYTDLGTYATEQLRQVVAYQKSYLAEAQELERKHVSQKTVATLYGGLIGKMLDPTTEVLPGYTPVVVAPPEPEPETPQVAAAAATTGGGDTGGSQQTQQDPNASTLSGDSSDTSAPTFQILGNNPARIPMKTVYVDLGVIMNDDHSPNVGIRYYVDGEQVTSIQLDTSAPREYIIRYEATDVAGNIGRATRTVIVYNPAPPPEPVSTSTTTATQQASQDAGSAATTSTNTTSTEDNEPPAASTSTPTE